MEERKKRSNHGRKKRNELQFVKMSYKTFDHHDEDEKSDNGFGLYL